MSLLFTLLHAHRRAPVSLLPVVPLPLRNISITVHTHLSADEASSSRFDPFPRDLFLSLSPFLSYVLSERIALVLSRTHMAVSFFRRLLLGLLLLSRCYPASTPLCTTFLAPSFISLSLRTLASSRFFIFSPVSLAFFFSLSDQFRRLLLIFVIFVEKRTYLFPFSLAIITYGLRAEPEEREGGKEINKREKYSTLSFSLSLSHGSLCAFANARRLWEAANASV